MSMANKIKYAERYVKKGYTIDQLKKIVKLGVLTLEEFKEITSIDFE